jgi:hypothetical protein
LERQEGRLYPERFSRSREEFFIAFLVVSNPSVGRWFPLEYLELAASHHPLHGVSSVEKQPIPSSARQAEHRQLARSQGENSYKKHIPWKVFVESRMFLDPLGMGFRG